MAEFDMGPPEGRGGAGGRPAVLAVSAFVARLKMGLRELYPTVHLRGELTNVRALGSGHIYFTLKDRDAQLSAVLFRGNALRQTVTPRDGLQVIVEGEITVYEARGQLQLVVRNMVDDGEGQLQRAFVALKRKLEEAGLFATERKRPLPTGIKRIGVVTSPTGAAVRDFVQILRRRGWRGQVVVLPVRVQGAEAVGEIAEAIELAGSLRFDLSGRLLPQNEAGEPLDVLVVGRGGGSLEDLWAFNEEPVVRAVASSAVPVISAVGHEIDFALSDFAADVRAETPSAAAELISSQFLEQAARAETAAEALRDIIGQELKTRREQLRQLARQVRLLTPRAQIERGYLRIDDLRNQLQSSVQRGWVEQRGRVGDLATRYRARDPALRVQLASHRLLELYKRLQAASPQSVLNRGFAIVRDANGVPVMRRAAFPPAGPVELEFADGRIALEANSARES